MALEDLELCECGHARHSHPYNYTLGIYDTCMRCLCPTFHMPGDADLTDAWVVFMKAGIISKEVAIKLMDGAEFDMSIRILSEPTDKPQRRKFRLSE